MRMKEMHSMCCMSIESFGGGGNFRDISSEEAILSRSRSLPASFAAFAGRSNSNAGPLQPGSQSIVAGILCKWTNYGKGWRSRWFLLRDGVLSYAKIQQPESLNLLTPNDDIRFIGEISTNRLSRLDARGGRRKQQKFVGVVQLKISSFRESKSDDRRFYIFTASKTLHLRTDTKEDRTAWLQALLTVRGLFSPRMIYDNRSIVPSELFVSTETLKKRLLEEGMNETLVKDCEQIMLSEFSEIRGQLQVLCDERSNLIHTIRQLEAANIETEATDMHSSEYQLPQDEFSTVEERKYRECNTTESSDDIKVKEFEDVSDEDEMSFYDTKECFTELGSLRADSYGIDESREFEGQYSCIDRRQRLPNPAEKEKRVSLWSMIKDNVGKDLTRVCLPVYFNEPISSLQKCCEDLEYSYLLDRAYEHGKNVRTILKTYGNSLLRALNVAAFAVSGYASSVGRHCKPFNPLLGETYEADYPEKGIRFFSEKVSHHPTLIACHCEGRGWKFWGDSNIHSKFWGRSIQLEPVGILTLEFDDGEIFQWSKVTTNIYNLILGKVYCDHHGIMHVRGNRQYSCKLTFKEQSILDRNPHQVRGYVEDAMGKKAASLIGKWDDCIYYVDYDGAGYSKGSFSLCDATLLWKSCKPPPNLTRYNLPSFAITLNELTEGLKEKLPPTDSRLRPDQRHLENGEYDKANEEKQRLEKRQRISRKLQENGWRPMWFQREREDGPFRYVGGYWEAREAGKWEDCPDIFGELNEELDAK